MLTKYKIINHIMQKGKKTKSEKIIKKSIKELQKTSKKPTKELIQLSIILSSIIFKIHTTIKNKKNRKNRKKKALVRPAFIRNQNKRFSFAIKLIVSAAKKNYYNYSHNKLKEEFFLTTKLKNYSIKTKKKLEKQALNKKYLLKYYKWT